MILDPGGTKGESKICRKMTFATPRGGRSAPPQEGGGYRASPTLDKVGVLSCKLCADFRSFSQALSKCRPLPGVS